MFKTITSKIVRDPDYPERQFVIDVLTRVLDGTLYDHLPYDFHREKNDAEEYIPLRDRRPSVKYALCKTVVDDSVSLLFSEGHFPAVDCEDEATRNKLAELIKDSKLNEVMIEAATIGSVGSVAIFMRVLSGRVFFEAKNTQFLTPVWRDDAPDTLASITEKYKVKGRVLKDGGYSIADDDLTADFWFQRIWDDQAETWYLPWKVRDDKAKAVVDTAKTKKHGLGYVPAEWVKNLPGGNGVDGACTFNDAIDTSIEINYQLSQAGRGLKYSSDPTLLIREPAIDEQGSIVKGGGNAIVVSADGDAKMLEINGTAAQAVIDYVRMLRELALESIHGNRANADKLSAAQSGRAMELMNQALIWLADKLRISYGEGALLSMLRKIVQASTKYPLMVGGEKIEPLNTKEKLSLRWPAWYAPTYADKQTEAETLTTLRTGGLLSRETAVKSLADGYDIEDPQEELKKIDADPPALAAETPKLQKPNSDSSD
ncbi:phage portal protein [Xanthomonas sp. MUS 060]|uniref:phage portal protein n=1 Tax=Xanthomonas sp. MUS 060 TaxID=1588031 RepID=UPI0005F2F8E2|nr:phage portal protein [Xanthomonas sp. MUS 060]